MNGYKTRRWYCTAWTHITKRGGPPCATRHHLRQTVSVAQKKRSSSDAVPCRTCRNNHSVYICVDFAHHALKLLIYTSESIFNSSIEMTSFPSVEKQGRKMQQCFQESGKKKRKLPWILYRNECQSINTGGGQTRIAIKYLATHWPFALCIAPRINLQRVMRKVRPFSDWALRCRAAPIIHEQG